MAEKERGDTSAERGSTVNSDLTVWEKIKSIILVPIAVRAYVKLNYSIQPFRATICLWVISSR